ncbi:PspC domain-containing protein [Alkalicoccobacillus gibsonii]|jgi:phage shock protein PspC (stress-responsive transcriptional regulator)|uniref:PspC domain-containing protein n=1 Tax=Alkalicoccobacillus gibsonii TaxID=79881 RepID=A0ABU9VP62_9BACI|nr:PspC domain-containing protein [Alkalicoccobacillus gibsonii]MBM0066148.1 PspC domain-containing protein [Alkalicoccobacillus gibsonii]
MKKLYRSQNDRKLAGVCGGIAEQYNFDVSLLRIIWALLVFFTSGTALLIYIIMALVVPNEEEMFDD